MDGSADVWAWEKVTNFGSLRELDSFLAWMQSQLTTGVAQEVAAPAEATPEFGDRWLKHSKSGALWRLVPKENPYGPGFWPMQDQPSDVVAGKPLNRRWPA